MNKVISLGYDKVDVMIFGVNVDTYSIHGAVGVTEILSVLANSMHHSLLSESIE